MLASLVPLLLLLAIRTDATVVDGLAELNITAELTQKVLPFPTVPPHISRTHRVGAQRLNQFGKRCWDQESCIGCVCCGACTLEDSICLSPPGSLDFCLLYEKLSRHTNLEKLNTTVSYDSLPDDFPDLP